MEDARLQYLVAQWQSNRLSAAEQQEITAFMADPGNREQFVSLLDKAIIEEGAIPAFDEAAWMPVIQNVLQSDKAVQHTLYPERRRSIRWLAAAAVAALLVSAGAFYFINQPTDKKITADAVLRPQDVAPGQDVAILTLADGTTVQLDSAGRQTIRQGQTTVNQQNGQLQYSSGEGSEEVTYNTLTVPRGGQFQVVLPDGSKVWLNAASSLVYPTAFTGKERKVELKGQGYFEVAQNSRQPFVVKVNDMQVQVLGTSFDIMAYPDEKTINTTLINGSVKVQYGATAQQLRPGQQAQLNNTTFNISIQNVDADQVIAWKTGFFEFDNEHLATIMRQLSRWYDIEINLKDIETQKLFGGRISRHLPLSEILNMLSTSGATFRLEGRRLEVSTVK